jgi:hypothetical protein
VGQSFANWLGEIFHGSVRHCPSSPIWTRRPKGTGKSGREKNFFEGVIKNSYTFELIYRIMAEFATAKGSKNKE